MRDQLTFARDIAWWLIKSLGLCVVVTLGPILLFGPPLWFMASLGNVLRYQDLARLVPLGYSTAMCAAEVVAFHFIAETDRRKEVK